MRIHTDTLTQADLYRTLPAGCYLEASQKGSRKRARAFEVSMSAAPGTDSHGIKRCYATNSGRYGTGYAKAATYIEWGDWMVALLDIDPAAIIGPYDGAADFVEQTSRWAPHRPKRESAVAHARRWAEGLAGVVA